MALYWLLMAGSPLMFRSAGVRLRVPAPSALTAGSIGALHAVQRTVGIDVQRRDAQVAVVLQRDLDQLLQRWITEELAPAKGLRPSLGDAFE